MRRPVQSAAVSLVTLLCAACYHVTVETGLPPSQDTISQEWAPSWIAGLVPPPIVATAAICPNGVARVETQMSFLNGLVSALTFSIFTPMQIDVTCASGPRSDGVSGATQIRSGPDKEAALALAVELSRTLRQPVYVRF